MFGFEHLAHCCRQNLEVCIIVPQGCPLRCPLWRPLWCPLWCPLWAPCGPIVSQTAARAVFSRSCFHTKFHRRKWPFAALSGHLCGHHNGHTKTSRTGDRCLSILGRLLKKALGFNAGSGGDRLVGLHMESPITPAPLSSFPTKSATPEASMFQILSQK